jgi:uncharacterized alkaline shock family protein YloU
MTKNSMELSGIQGKIKIANEVVLVIAQKAVKDIKGIVSFSGGLTKGIADALISKNNSKKGVKLEAEENQVIINLSIAIEYGVVIPELVKTVQEKVKSSIEIMTDIKVAKVNVYIQDIKIS